MFPQSELDNYKLQVELLQEKLQRSEISRQQLEQKLDKILQKRDEHEKMMRSKARQKYQLFLEEQKRRNERNKQLVQMLERIEQQTEIMNARSERLKMMKLQYEMYFAKLVHTQTRRCIQDSVQPMMTHFMPTTSNQPVWSTVQLQQSATTGPHNFVTNSETAIPLAANDSQQCYATESEENMPLNTSEVPTLAKFMTKQQTYNSIDPKHITKATLSATSSQQLYQYKGNVDLNKPMTDSAEMLETNASLYNEMKAKMTTNPSLTYLLTTNKKQPELKPQYNLTAKTTSSTFEEIPNVAMITQQQHHQQQQKEHILNELPRTTMSSNENLENNYKTNLAQPSKRSPAVKEKPLKYTNETLNNAENSNQNSNTNSLDVRPIKTPQVESNCEMKTKMPNEQLKPSNSLHNSSPETFSSSSTNKIYLKKQSTSIEETEERKSSAPAVSIEKIENEIYGELLTPPTTEEAVKSPEATKNKSNLLDNLITQPETISATEIPAKQEIPTIATNQEYNTANNNNDAAANNEEQNQMLYNYEQNTINNDDFNNVAQAQESSENFNEFANYENVEAAPQMDETNQQQYDYSNYDPTQYSYPGYVYDETTGEYKPDPNAPLEQYSAEGYEQQYQQQDYDYNQTYAEESATGLTNDVEKNTVNSEETQQQALLSHVTATGNDALQQPSTAQPEPIIPQAITEAEEVSTSATPKMIKPTSILSSADKNEAQKKKKRVNFIDSSETDDSAVKGADKAAASNSKIVNENVAASSESDFDFSSSTTEAEAKGT